MKKLKIILIAVLVFIHNYGCFIPFAYSLATSSVFETRFTYEHLVFELEDIDCLIYDLDGTIINIIPIYRKFFAWTYWKIMNGYAPDHSEWPSDIVDLEEGFNYYDTYVLGYSPREKLPDVIAIAESSGKTITHTANNYYTSYSNFRNAELVRLSEIDIESLLMPGAREHLTRMKRLRKKQYIASVSPDATTKRLILEKAGLLDLFDDTNFCENLDGKISAIRNIIETGGYSPSQVMFCDDSPRAVATVRNQADLRDIIVVGFPSSDREKAAMIGSANYVISNFHSFDTPKIITGLNQYDIGSFTLIWAINVLYNRSLDGVAPQEYDYNTKITALMRIFIYIRSLGIVPVDEVVGELWIQRIILEWQYRWLPYIENKDLDFDNLNQAQSIINLFRENNILSLKGIHQSKIAGRTFIVRVDFNDIHFNENDENIDDIRLNAGAETIRYITAHGGKVVLLTHSGRPSGDGVEPKYSIDHVAAAVRRLIDIDEVELLRGKEVGPDKYSIVTDEICSQVELMDNGGIAILDNTRFDWREKSKIPSEREGLAYDISTLGDIFVLDGFPISHRPDSTVVEICKTMPTVRGFWMEKEIVAHNSFLNHLKDAERKPMAALFGGAKPDKIPLIKDFSKKLKDGDKILIGGLLAGIIQEKEQTWLDRMRSQGIKIVFALDFSDGTNRDIGEATIASFKDELRTVSSVYWNGPMGMFEERPYEFGSYAIAQHIKKLIDSKSIQRAFLSGGETAFVVKSALVLAEETMRSIPELYISTGGGTSTDFFAYEENIGLRNIWGVSPWFREDDKEGFEFLQSI